MYPGNQSNQHEIFKLNNNEQFGSNISNIIITDITSSTGSSTASSTAEYTKWI